MSNLELKTHFKKLLEREKDSRMQLVVKENVKVMLWEKGQKKRETFETTSYSNARKALSLKGNENSSLIGKNVLYSFVLNGLNYFGKAKCLKLGTLELDCHDELFKSEKRQSFRLMTYPHQKVFLKIKTDLKAEDNRGNVVDFRTGLSQTGLFKNFIDLMGLTEDELESDGYFSFRVLDLSVSGVSIIVNEASEELFYEGCEFSSLVLKMSGSTINIPKARSLYLVDMVSQNSKQRLKKVAFEFLNVDNNLDSQLSKIINASLRNTEADFEDFI